MSRVREFYGDGLVMIELPADADDAGSSHGVQFSSDDAGSSGKTSKAIHTKRVAELTGLDEGELVYRLRRDKAKLGRLDGQLVVKAADLDRLVKAGKVPPLKRSAEDRTKAVAASLGIDLDGTATSSTSSNSSTEPAKPEPIPDPFTPPVDPAVEARTKAMAGELGISLDLPSTSSTDDDKPAPRRPGAPITARADDDEGYRLGKPRRWGQT
jgi:hypothetical protein